MFTKLLSSTLIFMTLSCAAVGVVPTDPGQSPISKELDTVSRLAMAHESGEALSFVIRAREHYVAFLQSNEKDVKSLVKTIGCALQAYIVLKLPAANTLRDLATQYVSDASMCE